MVASRRPCCRSRAREKPWTVGPRPSGGVRTWPARWLSSWAMKKRRNSHETRHCRPCRNHPSLRHGPEVLGRGIGGDQDELLALVRTSAPGHDRNGQGPAQDGQIAQEDRQGGAFVTLLEFVT